MYFLRQTSCSQVVFALTLSFLLLATPNIQAQIKLPKIIGNQMVLQRHQKVPIWGWAKKRQKITVSFLHHTIKTRADQDGRWRIDLPEMNEGGPYEMLIYGKNDRIKLTDILIGEVWVCSGQSNMEWPVSKSNHAEREIRQAKYPHIRLFDLPNQVAFSPQGDIESGKWEASSPETIGSFSAVAYFFGRELHQKLDVPIGLISTNWGGTNIETWTSGQAITQVEGFENSIDDLNEDRMKELEKEQKARLDKLLAEIGDSKGGLIDGKALWAEPEIVGEAWKDMKLPVKWESAGLKDLDGVVWFRKEITLEDSSAIMDGKLHLGPIDDSDKTWINGVLIGETYNEHDKDRVYPVPSGILRLGKNIIAVRVEDYQGGGGLWGNPEQLKLIGGKSTLSLAGNWKYKVSPVDLKLNQTGIHPNDAPTLLFNGMLNPIVPYAMQGVIWYQGESNASRAYEYRTLFPTMIQDWRNHWNRDFPFLFVQLANFKKAHNMPVESDWAELREAQTKALSLNRTGMAVAIDIGETDDIHPRNKQDVGLRLALGARKLAYKEEVVHSGPVYKSMTIEDGKIMIELDHIGSGLMAKDRYGYVKGFTIAGEDKNFVWAKAAIKDGNIVVWQDHIKNPVAVRYGWADNPVDANLYNKDGLPTSPFRTDTWTKENQQD